MQILISVYTYSIQYIIDIVDTIIYNIHLRINLSH